jgi:hypothetical protein
MSIAKDTSRAAQRAQVVGKILHADGSVEDIPDGGFRRLADLIGANLTDVVMLRHLGPPLVVMVIDDRGYESSAVTVGETTTLVPTKALRPENAAATALYLANCIPGTTHKIVGDVAVVLDSWFGS